MQQNHAKPIREYDFLIKLLKSNGKYQVRLCMLLLLYWLLSGLNEGAFQLAIARKIDTATFIIEQSMQIVVLLIGIQLSFHFSRTLINAVSIFGIVAGALVMTLGAFLGDRYTFLAGEFTISLLHYSVSQNLLMVAIEYFPKSNYGLLWFIAMTAFTLGKLLALWIYQGQLADTQWATYVALPCAALYLLTLVLVRESPRYWIDHNLTSAEELLRDIAQTNQTAYEPIEAVLQRQYFWHRIALTKYSFNSVAKHKSVSYDTYILCVCGLLLGVICRCPDFIQHLRQHSSFEVEDTLETAWVSCFQLCALVPAYLGSRTMRRKSVVVGCSIVLMVLTVLLAVLELTDFYVGNALVYSMAIFGLSSFFAMGYFYFLVLSAIEFFPHTVRTLGCGLLFCCYRLGRLLFSMHIEFIEEPYFLQRDSNMMELVLTCAALMLFHSCLMWETFMADGKYDLEEIEEKQTEDY